MINSVLPAGRETGDKTSSHPDHRESHVERRPRGRPLGYAAAGTFEWDARPGHHHRHFTTYAQYRLLDSSGQTALRSQKEAFCLTNTDAIDYTVAGANWRPDNTDLHATCGDHSGATGQRVAHVPPYEGINR